MENMTIQEPSSDSTPAYPRTWRYYTEKTILYVGVLVIATAIVSFAFMTQWPTAYAIIQGVMLMFMIVMYAAIAFGGSDNKHALGERSPFLFYLLLMYLGWTWPAWIRSAILIVVLLWTVRCCAVFDRKREQVYLEKMSSKAGAQPAT